MDLVESPNMSKKRRHSHRRGRFLEALISARGRGRHRGRGRGIRATPTLADIPAGSQVQVRAFRPMDPVRRQRLQAYGLCLGQCLQVVQQTPVTVIMAGHTELAMEKDLAASIVVRVKA